MIKILTLALTISAVALGTTFAGDCNGGGCSKKDKKTDAGKEQVSRVVEF